MFRRPTGRASGVLTLLWLFFLTLVVTAEEPKPQPKDAQPTDPDFAVQGEYVGEVFTPAGNVPLGVQVIALGKGKFKGNSYLEGLPGAAGTVAPAAARMRKRATASPSSKAKSIRAGSKTAC